MKLYTVKEAAAYLHVSKSTVYQLKDEGRLSYYKIGARGKGGKKLFQEEELDRFLNECLVEKED